MRWVFFLRFELVFLSKCGAPEILFWIPTANSRFSALVDFGFVPTSASTHWLRMCFSNSVFTSGSQMAGMQIKMIRWCMFFFDSSIRGQLSDLRLLILKKAKPGDFSNFCSHPCFLQRWLCHVHMFQVRWNYQRFAKIRHSIKSPCGRLLELLYSFSSTETQVFTQNVQDSGIWRSMEKTIASQKIQKNWCFLVHNMVVLPILENGS